MLTVDDYGKIRRVFRDGMSIREIARTFHHSRAPRTGTSSPTLSPPRTHAGKASRSRPGLLSCPHRRHPRRR